MPPPGSGAPLAPMRAGTPGLAQPGMDAAALVRANESLSQRVKELEVINDLYQGRVRELEEENDRLKLKNGEDGSKRKADDMADSQQMERKRSRTEGDGNITESAPVDVEAS